MAQYHLSSYKLDRCSRCASACSCMLFNCGPQGSRICRKQDIGWARRCADDCLGINRHLSTAKRITLRKQQGFVHTVANGCWGLRDMGREMDLARASTCDGVGIKALKERCCVLLESSSKVSTFEHLPEHIFIPSLQSRVGHQVIHEKA